MHGLPVGSARSTLQIVDDRLRTELIEAVSALYLQMVNSVLGVLATAETDGHPGGAALRELLDYPEVDELIFRLSQSDIGWYRPNGAAGQNSLGYCATQVQLPAVPRNRISKMMSHRAASRRAGG